MIIPSFRSGRSRFSQQSSFLMTLFSSDHALHNHTHVLSEWCIQVPVQVPNVAIINPKRTKFFTVALVFQRHVCCSAHFNLMLNQNIINFSLSKNRQPIGGCSGYFDNSKPSQSLPALAFSRAAQKQEQVPFLLERVKLKNWGSLQTALLIKHHHRCV